MNKRILFVVTAFVLLFTNVASVSATPVSDAKKEKKNTEKKLDSVNEDIENIEDEMESLEEEASQYQQELVDLLVTIQIINADIESKNEEIAIAQAEYDEAVEKQQAQKHAMDMRIKYMYEKGNISYMQILLEAGKYTDAVNKATYSEKLYEYDRYQLYMYEQTKQEVAQKQEALEADLEEIEEIKADAVEQEMELQILIDEYSENIENFDEQLQDAKAQAEKYKDDIKKQTDEIKALEAEEAKAAAEAAKKAAEEAAKKKAAEEAKKKAEEEAKEKDKEGNSGESSGDSSDNGESSQSSEPAPESSSDSGNSGGGSSSGGSAKGQEIANFAVQFVGNPYVPGGTSLTEGADCSGFTQAVYQNFGVSLPRTSGSQALVGTGVSYSEAAPGDIIYYGGHVGIYIGNGLIVHASTQATGIKISSALYRSIISVRRIV